MMTITGILILRMALKRSGEADPEDADEEDEIMHRREEELQAELSLATKRCQELKETLQVTKSFMDNRGRPEGGKTKIAVDIIADGSDDDELEAVEGYDEEDEEGNSWEAKSCSSVSSSAIMNGGNNAVVKKQDSSAEITPRVNRQPPAAQRAPSYKNLVDAPSPSGRLGDRIIRLKQRCILALGKRAFDEAYSYLKQHAANDEGDDIYDDGASSATKERRVKEILGADKAHYMPLIDQLIFMEETHSG